MVDRVELQVAQGVDGVGVAQRAAGVGGAQRQLVEVGEPQQHVRPVRPVEVVGGQGRGRVLEVDPLGLAGVEAAAGGRLPDRQGLLVRQPHRQVRPPIPPEVGHGHSHRLASGGVGRRVEGATAVAVYGDGVAVLIGHGHVRVGVAVHVAEGQRGGAGSGGPGTLGGEGLAVEDVQGVGGRVGIEEVLVAVVVHVGHQRGAGRTGERGHLQRGQCFPGRLGLGGQGGPGVHRQVAPGVAHQHLRPPVPGHVGRVHRHRRVPRQRPPLRRRERAAGPAQRPVQPLQPPSTLTRSSRPSPSRSAVAESVISAPTRELAAYASSRSRSRRKRLIGLWLEPEPSGSRTSGKIPGGDGETLALGR